ncbi:MAG: primosomal protein N' [Eudoraea sp.]
MNLFINVILPIPIDRLFTYSITPKEAEHLSPGFRVAVPFGKSKIYTALVYEIHKRPPGAYEAKPIHDILDEDALVTKVQLEHWRWISEYYMCSIGEVFRAAMPNTFLLESETTVQLNTLDNLDDSTLPDDDFMVVEALRHQPHLKVEDIMNIVDKKNVFPILNRLLKLQVIILQEEIRELYKPKLAQYLSLNDKYKQDFELENLLKSLSRAPKQSQAVLMLFQLEAATKKPVKSKDLEKEGNISKAIIRSLIKKEVLVESFIQQDRIEYSGSDKLAPIKQLNSYQEKAFNSLEDQFKEKRVALLRGVTSSGKTEIYVRLLAACIHNKQQALYLVPEIAITTQLIRRLQEYFGPKIAVFHSKYNGQERAEIWKNVLENSEKAQIVLGARSSVFLPFKNLGLIIVDEEHEISFKQFDPAPRYHARDTAIVLGSLFNAKVLLGSATPSIESYYNVLNDKYGYAQIDRRYGNVLMPDIELVDIKEQHRKKRMKGHFSERLREEIQEALLQNEQIILFQNRRGFAPILECDVCGNSPQCPNCDVSLTYHKQKGQLRCHYCGYNMSLPNNCPACGSRELDTKGFGTEQVEQELIALFPDLKVGRMDHDTTRGKFAYAKIIQAFEEHELDILVGTQMLTKGLDFRNVGLVGIMNADSLLNFPDFRAHERTYQMLTQVSGRAGRTKKRGKVIIQTYNPYHQILKQVTTGDYETMFKEQLYERSQFKYPPYNRIIRLTFKHKDFNKLNEASLWFAQALRNILTEDVLGPEYPAISRIRNQYIKHILIKIPKKAPLVITKKNIKRIQNSFDAISQYRSVRVIYNVDYF